MRGSIITFYNKKTEHTHRAREERKLNMTWKTVNAPLLSSSTDLPLLTIPNVILHDLIWKNQCNFKTNAM